MTTQFLDVLPLKSKLEYDKCITMHRLNSNCLSTLGTLPNYWSTFAAQSEQTFTPVSYTHLTLPTMAVV